jgi:hypothetical protein
LHLTRNHLIHRPYGIKYVRSTNRVPWRLSGLQLNRRLRSSKWGTFDGEGWKWVSAKNEVVLLVGRVGAPEIIAFEGAYDPYMGVGGSNFVAAMCLRRVAPAKSVCSHSERSVDLAK